VGANFDLWAGSGVFGVAPSVKRGISRVKYWDKIQGAGVCGLYLLYGAKPPRRETVSGGGCSVIWAGFYLSLSACRTIGAGLLLPVWYRGAAQTFEQVFETGVRK